MLVVFCWWGRVQPRGALVAGRGGSAGLAACTRTSGSQLAGSTLHAARWSAMQAVGEVAQRQRGAKWEDVKGDMGVGNQLQLATWRCY